MTNNQRAETTMNQFDEDRYFAACKAATTAQGLDPVVARLTAEGIPHEVEQTGGFTMVVAVKVADGFVCITNDGMGLAPYMVGFYPGTNWIDGGEDETFDFDVTLDRAVEVIGQHGVAA